MAEFVQAPQRSGDHQAWARHSAAGHDAAGGCSSSTSARHRPAQHPQRSTRGPPRVDLPRSPPAAAQLQVSWAQLSVLGRLQLLSTYVLQSQVLGSYELSATDSAALAQQALPRAASLLLAASTAHWAATTPVDVGAAARGGGSESLGPLDPAQLVVALRIGDSGPAASAPKRARLSHAADSYAGSLVLSAWVQHDAEGGSDVSFTLHAVRDILDLKTVALLTAQRLLSLQPQQQGGVQLPGRRSPPPVLPPLDMALWLAQLLLSARQAGSLRSLLRLLGPDAQDARQLFLEVGAVCGCVPGCLAACSRARAVRAGRRLFATHACACSHNTRLRSRGACCRPGRRRTRSLAPTTLLTSSF